MRAPPRLWNRPFRAPFVCIRGPWRGNDELIRFAMMMCSLCEDSPCNIAVLVAAALVFGVSLALSLSQATTADVACVKAMIPHHSIMTSEPAQTSDPRVRLWADELLEAQVREIEETKTPVADLESDGIAPNSN